MTDTESQDRRRVQVCCPKAQATRLKCHKTMMIKTWASLLLALLQLLLLFAQSSPGSDAEPDHEHSRDTFIASGGFEHDQDTVGRRHHNKREVGLGNPNNDIAMINEHMQRSKPNKRPEVIDAQLDVVNGINLDHQHRKQEGSFPQDKPSSPRIKKRKTVQDSDRSQINNSDTMTMTTTAPPSPTTNIGQDDAKWAELKCRVEKNLYLDFEQYKHYTCANCYNHIPKILFSRKFIYNKATRIWLYDDLNKRTLLPNETDVIRTTFKAESTYNKWHECCQQAKHCCLRNSVYLPKSRDSQGELVDEEPRDKCPATWDGLSCWPDSRAGRVAKHDCPDYIYFLEFVPVCKGQVTKQCFANGSWFIRNDHEWSDYNSCPFLPLYATRMLIGSVWHLVSAVVIGPALVVLDRLPNRGGSKRVRILSNLLFWLLVNGLLAATQKIGIIGGVFRADSNLEEPPRPPSTIANLNSTLSQLTPEGALQPNTTTALPGQMTRLTRTLLDDRLELAARRFTGAKGRYEQLAQESGHHEANICDDYNTSARLHLHQAGGEAASGKPSATNNHHQEITLRGPLELSNLNSDTGGSSAQTHSHTSSALNTTSPLSQQSSRIEDPPPLKGPQIKGRSRCKRDSSNKQTSYRKQQSALVVFICWIFSVGIRITRLLGYAWMFTGAVYLCSVLHFAPAEPPTSFIKWLMILTNGFPVVIGLVYMIARTIYEPSPMTIIAKLPYYYIMGDNDYVEYLWATQLDCWLLQSRYDSIEEIADFPNLVLIILNGGLFVVTLIIMCRISRPGSTRPEMSLGDYFKAAGTLVLLYGAHYALFVYRPPVEGCIKGQVMYYSFLFVDGIQGIAVSYVFCYRTSEGREIIGKWWSNFRENRLDRLCCRKRPARELGLLNANSRSNQSTRSNNSTCNGKETTTNLININDMESEF